MKYDNSGLEFDFKTQRFLVGRWETEEGLVVLQKIIDAIKKSADIRGILDEYVLEHPENRDSYAYPIYPENEMQEDRFWVLNHDDLRGVKFYNEDFSSTKSLQKKAFGYSRFHNVDLSNNTLDRNEFSRVHFSECKFINSVITDIGIYSVFNKCDFTSASFIDSVFIGLRFSDCDFSDVKWSINYFDELEIDHLCLVDRKLKFPDVEKFKCLKPENRVEVHRMLRIAFEKAEIWDKYDCYLFEEKKAYRKLILYSQSKKQWTVSGAWLKDWFINVFFAYGLRPSRILFLAITITFLFALFYWLVGEPSGSESFWKATYFSITTFSTLGYGDLTYEYGPDWLSIVSSLQAWVGAAAIASFVATLMRKLLRG